MKDKLIRATAKEGMVRIFATQTTELVNEATKVHNCTPTASAALGRMLTAGAMMGAMLKSDKEVLTIQINGGGPAKGVTVTSYSDCGVKGYIGNPNVDLPLNSENGKLNVGEAIGKNGILTVIKDLGLKDPYVGQVPIFSGEIAEDLAYYFTVSEQIPSAVALGVLVDTDLSIKAAGGFIIQLMPGCDELLGDLITYRLEEIPTLTTMLSEGKNIKEVIEFIFEGMDLKINEEEVPTYKCNCSREKVEKALASIGYKDLTELKEEGKTEELKCHFCNKSYKFTSDDIGNLLEVYKKEN
ncbi:MAG: Hsp33 family molecular chaperone HslO [Sarcina sp.]